MNVKFEISIPIAVGARLRYLVLSECHAKISKLQTKLWLLAEQSGLDIGLYYMMRHEPKALRHINNKILSCLQGKMYETIDTYK